MVVESNNDKKCLQWDLKGISEAIDAMKMCEKGLRQVAREFGVPVTTVEPRLPDTPEMRTSAIMRTLCLVRNSPLLTYIQSEPLKCGHLVIP